MTGTAEDIRIIIRMRSGGGWVTSSLRAAIGEHLNRHKLCLGSILRSEMRASLGSSSEFCGSLTGEHDTVDATEPDCLLQFPKSPSSAKSAQSAFPISSTKLQPPDEPFRPSLPEMRHLYLYSFIRDQLFSVRVTLAERFRFRAANKPPPLDSNCDSPKTH